MDNVGLEKSEIPLVVVASEDLATPARITSQHGEEICSVLRWGSTKETNYLARQIAQFLESNCVIE